MATIGFLQNRLGRTDGVSLEVDKWRTVLTRLGHRVVYCAGNDDVPGNRPVPEVYMHHPMTWRILRNGTVAMQDYSSEAELEQDIYDHADAVERRLHAVIEAEKIDVLVPNNLCSGGYQPAAAIAIHRVLRQRRLPAIIHSHDFYFEESGEVRATGQTVASIYERYFPSKLPQVQHVVINRLAQEQLKLRKGIAAEVVPNVFDFAQPAWGVDEFNRDFRAAFGLGSSDLVFLQATRILDRKSVELAIDLMARLGARRRELVGAATAGGGQFGENSRLVLLCAGIVETIGISGRYWDLLQEWARTTGVELVHVGERVRHSRGRDASGPIFSLWDAYAHADFVTYPSTWEGWGNQFIEAVFARLPVVLFEYPVWKSDIRDLGFKVVSLGDRAVPRPSGLLAVEPARIESAASEVIALLRSPERRAQWGAHNFELGRRHLSLEALRERIEPLFKRALGPT